MGCTSSKEEPQLTDMATAQVPAARKPSNAASRRTSQENGKSDFMATFSKQVEKDEHVARKKARKKEKKEKRLAAGKSANPTKKSSSNSNPLNIQ